MEVVGEGVAAAGEEEEAVITGGEEEAVVTTGEEEEAVIVGEGQAVVVIVGEEDGEEETTVGQGETGAQPRALESVGQVAPPD